MLKISFMKFVFATWKVQLLNLIIKFHARVFNLKPPVEDDSCLFCPDFKMLHMIIYAGGRRFGDGVNYKRSGIGKVQSSWFSSKFQVSGSACGLS